MVKKRKGYNVASTGRMMVVFLFFISIIATMGYTLVFNLKRASDMNKELKGLKDEKSSLLDKEAATKADIKRLSDPEYIVRYAREKHFFSKENEIILIMGD